MLTNARKSHVRMVEVVETPEEVMFVCAQLDLRERTATKVQLDVLHLSSLKSLNQVRHAIQKFTGFTSTVYIGKLRFV